MSTAIIAKPVADNTRHGPMGWDAFVSLFNYLRSCGGADVTEFPSIRLANAFMLKLADQIGSDQLDYLIIFREGTVVTVQVREHMRK
jgi:hypothetical protein